MFRHASVSRFLLTLGMACMIGFGFAGPALGQNYDPNNPGPGERAPAFTEVRIPVTTEASVPGTAEERQAFIAEGKVADLSQYIGIVYNFLISIAGMLASVMMIVGGFQYLTSAGDPGKIGAAKSRMANAFIGLILALGAYTILQTINPALLKFAPLSQKFESVKTEITFMPWCEDVAAGKPANTTVDPPIPAVPPIPVTPALPNPNQACGFIGKFMKGNEQQYCIYRGACSNKTTSTMARWQTCFQRAGLTQLDLKEEVAAGSTKTKNWPIATCLHCMQLTDASAAEMGHVTLDTACPAWQMQMESAFQALEGRWQGENNNGRRFWAYCRQAEKYPSCVGAAIDCYKVNRNKDEKDEGIGGAFRSVAKFAVPVYGVYSALTDTAGEGAPLFGCQGYDEEPHPTWIESNLTLEQMNSTYSYTYHEDLDFYPEHLTSVCMWNPCKNYLDPENNRRDFKAGCKIGGGFFDSGVIRFVRKNDFSGPDCRNR